MANTFGTVAEIISSNSDIALGTIKPESHIMKDLGVDSLAFLDIAFEIDQRFGIKMPIEDWIKEVNEGHVESAEYFLVGNLCRRIDALISGKTSATAAV
ncbi:MAG: acyl carrier protein [Hyphomicrobiaceae bacterium]|nr:MAG: acyl carrier protein [Hyphomicrobiaceae bacterium]